MTSWLIRSIIRELHDFLGASNCDHNEYQVMKERPLYRDIDHTLCGVNSTSRWERTNDTLGIQLCTTHI